MPSVTIGDGTVARTESVITYDLPQGTIFVDSRAEPLKDRLNREWSVS